ncbi:ATP-binding domain-containing protein [Bacillus licheniformis]
MRSSIFSSMQKLKLIDKETRTFQKGVVVIPVYLAKGIEFDAVIIYDASEKQYKKERERTLFYTACTRAMHELHLFSIGKETHFLNGVPNDMYTRRE